MEKNMKSNWIILLYTWNTFYLFIWSHPQHMDSPRPGIVSEPQLWPTQQLQQHQSFKPMCRARDQTHTPAVTWAAAVGFLTQSAMAGTAVICWLFDDSHSERCAMISHCGVCLFVCFSQAIPEVYASSQVRGWIRAVAAGPMPQAHQCHIRAS